MTKEEFLKIRDNNTMDVVPLLHYYHNISIKHNQKELSIDEFRIAYSHWLQIPIVAISHANIISTVIKKLEIHFKI